MHERALQVGIDWPTLKGTHMDCRNMPGFHLSRSPWRLAWSALLAGFALTVAANLAVAAQPRERAGPANRTHQHLDERFSHNQYYFDRGYSVPRPPPGSVSGLRGPDGRRYSYYHGTWYRRDGSAWIVWGAPIGVFVSVLPPFYTTIWWRGVPYYYANDTYYLWDAPRREYEVVAPPQGVDGAATTAPASNKLFAYPAKGQSEEQQKRDDYECHRWAVGQSGFDPTVSGGGVPADQAVAKRNEYYRAQVACLEGRGYTVK